VKFASTARALLVMTVAASEEGDAAPAQSHPPHLVVSNWPGAVTTSPRPAPDAVNVPAETTIWCELEAGGAESGAENGAVDPIERTSLHVEIQDGERRRVAVDRGVFRAPFHGRLFESPRGLGIYLVPDEPLASAASCTVFLRAASKGGGLLEENRARFNFHTRAAPATGTVELRGSCAATVDFAQRVFSGTLQPDFDTTLLFDQVPTCELLQAITGPAPTPAAASLERDWPLCGDYWTNAYFDGDPNFVRERETRRVDAIDAIDTAAGDAREVDGTLWRVHVEALPEAALYGIAADRPLAPDHPIGSKVLLADEARSLTAEVVAVDEAARVVTVRVARDATLQDAWRAPPPIAFPPDDPRTPAHFARGLLRLLRLDPSGTPAFWFARIDHQWDLVHLRFGRRLVVNFDRVPADLSSDGVVNGGKGFKNAREWHDVVRAVTTHLIDRYGHSLADSYFSIANEPDLGAYFWSDSRRALFAFYDVTVDAVLRAFEERELPSEGVKVGGLELAALAPKPELLPAFLAHCSPKRDDDPLDVNFAVAEPTLDGRRSRRVEKMSRAVSHDGHGSPCDFVSLHEYKHAAAAWQQLRDARATALAIDADFFKELALTSFESDPDWNPTDDPATHEMFFGNGFWPAWAADWTRRAVDAARVDPSFNRHETLLTVWPLDRNLTGIPTLSFVLDEQVGDGSAGAGATTRPATVPKDILRFLELTAAMGTRLFLINGGAATDPGAAPGGDPLAPVLAGFGSVHSGVAGDEVCALVYGHDPRDPENRAAREWEVTLTIDSFPFAEAEQSLFALDATHASPFELARALASTAPKSFTPEQVAALQAATELRPLAPAKRVGTKELHAQGAPLTTALRVPGNGIRFVRWRRAR
jgi:hypothetical protein